MRLPLLEKKLSLKADFVVTGLNGIGTVVGIFVVSGYIARTLGLDALGEYLLVRRTVTAVLGVLLLGLNVALPALLARDNEKGYGDSATVIFVTGTLPILLILTLLSGHSFLAADRALNYFIYATGFSCLTLAYALYRGHMNMIGANLLQFVAGTVVSLFAAAVADSIETLFVLMGMPMLAISAAAFLHRNRGVRYSRTSRATGKELLSFGAVRIPGFMFQFLLLAGVPLLSLPHLTLTDQAYLNAGISLVRVFLVIVGPLGIVLLPRVSHALSGGVTNNLRSNLSVLIQASLYYGALTAFVLSQLSHEILSVWLGEVTKEAGRGAMVLLYSVPFFVLSAVLRSPIDAGHQRGYNSFIYGTGAVVMLVTFFMLLFFYNNPFLSAGGAFLAGHVACGLASFNIARKLFGIPMLKKEFFISLVILLIILGVVLELLEMFLGGGPNLLIVSLAVIVAVCGGHFRLSRESWVETLRVRLGIPTSGATG